MFTVTGHVATVSRYYTVAVTGYKWMSMKYERAFNISVDCSVNNSATW